MVAPVLVAAFLVAHSLPAQTLTRVGDEFKVNAFTNAGDGAPSVSRRGVGFVVVWSRTDGSGDGVFARRFTSTGQPQGVDFQINVYTPGTQYRAAVAADTQGNFVVVWESTGQDGNDKGIFGRRFDFTGGPTGGEFQVNSFTPAYQGVPRLAVDGDGDFVVIWTSYQQDAYFGGVFGRRFSSTGEAQAVEFQINAATTAYDYGYAVAFQTGGQFVVSWVSYLPDESESDVFARRFDSNGSAQGDDFQVNVYGPGGQFQPDVAVELDGDFIIVWESSGQEGGGGQSGIFGRRFASNGAAQGGEFRVNAGTLGAQEDSHVAVDSTGNFVVAWRGYIDAQSQVDVFARRIDSSGQPQGNDLLVNTYTPASQVQVDVAGAGPSGFVVVWRSPSSVGADGVLAQRLGISTLAILDVDGNGMNEALSDGLLALRFIFGFSGATLTSGAIGANCTRCDSAAIQPYLSGLGLTLDIDDDDTLQPLTDGLLILRFLFGFTGTTLTSGAVDPDCGRCDSSTILPYLQTLD
jgi:hypothetical protein